MGATLRSLFLISSTTLNRAAKVSQAMGLCVGQFFRDAAAHCDRHSSPRADRMVLCGR